MNFFTWTSSLLLPGNFRCYCNCHYRVKHASNKDKQEWSLSWRWIYPSRLSIHPNRNCLSFQLSRLTNWNNKAWAPPWSPSKREANPTPSHARHRMRTPQWFSMENWKSSAFALFFSPSPLSILATCYLSKQNAIKHFVNVVLATWITCLSSLKSLHLFEVQKSNVIPPFMNPGPRD